ncbi:MAG TPA: hypothetical protein VEY67_09380 [Candidatus Dormibacteraeota bacterium]|nr:hypothetical protein [Candidatus Dormibacteraeota bacterium]
MLDLTLARIAQQEREQEIARRLLARAIREATMPCSRETFVPLAPRRDPGLRPALNDGGLP